MTIKGLLAIAAASAVIAAPQLASAGQQDFTLVNKTGYDIAEVYVSAASTEDWEEDVLGQDILTDGDRVNINFDRGSDACKWDLKVVYKDDASTAEWAAINLCKISVVNIFYNEKTEVTSATYE